MPTTFDQAWAEAAAFAPSQTTFIDTLEVEHASFIAPLRVCNSFERLLVDGMTFEPWFFELEMPALEPGTLPQLVVKIGNLNNSLRDELRKAAKATTPATLRYRQYLIVADTPTLGETMDIPLPIASISIPTGGDTITITCEPPNILNLPLHRQHYTIARFPGLQH